MKLQKRLFVLIILFSSFQVCFGQKDLTLLDSVSEPGCEYLLNRLNYLASETLKDSQSVGYIVIYGGENSVQNKFYEAYIRDYSKRFKLDEQHFIVISAKPINQLKIDFLISREGNIKPDVVAEEITFKLSETEKPIIFARESGEVIKIDGNLTFLGDCPACCIETANFYFLSEFLKSNPNFNAKIIIYSQTKKRFRELEKILQDEAINDKKIPAVRIKFIYGGIDKGISQYPDSYSTVEIKLVSIK